MRHCRPRVPPIPTIIHSIPHRSLPLHLPLTIPPTSMSAAASVVLGGGGPRPGRRRARPPRRFPSISIAFTSGEKPCGLLSPPAAAGGAMAAARGEGPAAVGGAEAEYMESGGRAPVVMVAAAVARDSAGSPASCCRCCCGGGGVGAAASVRPVLLLPVVVAVVPAFLPSCVCSLTACVRSGSCLSAGTDDALHPNGGNSLWMWPRGCVRRVSVRGLGCGRSTRVELVDQGGVPRGQAGTRIHQHRRRRGAR